MPITWLTFLRAHRAFVVALLCQGYFALFRFADWDCGVLRAALVLLMLGALVVLRFSRVLASEDAPAAPSSPPRWMKRAAGFALLANLLFVAYASLECVRTRVIPLDQGETTWRAARVLVRGENPYGERKLVDYYAFSVRGRMRKEAGVGPRLLEVDVEDALQRYDATLDCELGDTLLPKGEGPVAEREGRLVGYKYGPLLVVMTALFVPFGVPAAVVLLNGAACLGLFFAFRRLLEVSSGGRAYIGLAGLLLLAVDCHVAWNYELSTATDVWALLFCVLCVLAHRTGRPQLAGAALALAVGCKIFPSLLLLPLLLQTRSARPLAVFAAVLVAVFGPWLVWDVRGLVDNVFLWPTLMLTDSTSWMHYLSPTAASVVRGAAGLAIVLVWGHTLLGREGRIFWALAMSSGLLLLCGNALHNNYVPWMSLWVVAAVFEHLAPRAPAEPAPI